MSSPGATPARRRWLSALFTHVPLALVLGALGLAYAATMAPSITWANDGADSGDLVAAAAVGGVAHPSGYPTFLLLARAFQMLPLGDPALCTNILALSAALVAAALTACVVSELCAGCGRYARWAGALAALALGLSPVFWSQAIIAEVYSLNALFTASLALFALRDARPGAIQGWTARARGLVAGMAMGNHLTIGLMLLGWIAAVAAGAPAGSRLRRVAARLPWVGLGLLVYLYLPLRAAAQPPINWGDADNLAGFWWTISGMPYRRLAFGISSELAPQRVMAWAALLLAQFGPAGLVLGFGGLLYGGGARRGVRYGSATIAVGYSLYALAYAADDSYAYMLPAYVIFAIWLGCGCGEIMAALGRRRHMLAALAALASVVLISAPAPTTAARVDARHDDRAIAFAGRVMTSAPRGAIIVTSGDRDSFTLWYTHYALGARPDLAVAVGPMLDFPWYRECMRGTYPWLNIPETSPEDWAAALGAANRTARVCITQLDAPEVLICAGRQGQ